MNLEKQGGNTVNFSTEEKNKFFEWLNENYFNKNFGSVSKADFETYLFSLYYENKLNQVGKHRIMIDDYSIGQELGLTNSRVRSFKERKQLKYPIVDYLWKRDIVEYMNNAHFDEKKDLIKFSIPDVNVLKDLRHFVEVHGWYDEYQLNTKLFQCNLNTFINLCKAIDDENINNEDKDKLKNLAQKYSKEEEKNVIELFKNGEYKNGLLELAKISANELSDGIVNCLPFGNIGKELLTMTVKTIKKSIS